jgi:hypothetical protein
MPVLAAALRELTTATTVALHRVAPQASMAAAAGVDVDVTVVHGWFGHPCDFTPLTTRLSAAGITTSALSYPSLTGDIDRAAGLLITHLLAAPRPCVVVAHSLGGLVVRTALQRCPELAGTITTLVTLGTPHQGVDWRGLLAGVTELVDDSPVRCIAVAGALDVVVPAPHALWAGAHERHLVRSCGHVGLLAHPEVIAIVTAAVGASR